MKIPFEWEKINKNLISYTYRAKVIGGWIVNNFSYDQTKEQTLPISESTVFVPDPKHEWEV
jgi:hypothetical protein